MLFIRKRPLIVPAAATLVDSTERAGAGSSVTGIQFGTPSADRIIVAYALTTDAATTAATLGGIATATPVVADVGSNRIVLVWAPVPTGTSGTLVLTGASPLYNFGAIALTGVEPTYFDAGGALASSFDLSTNADGVVVAISIKAPAANTVWTGVTEDFDYAAAGGGVNVSMAHLAPTTSTTLTISASSAAAVLGVSFSKAA